MKKISIIIFIPDKPVLTSDARSSLMDIASIHHSQFADALKRSAEKAITLQWGSRFQNYNESAEDVVKLFPVGVGAAVVGAVVVGVAVGGAGVCSAVLFRYC